MPAPQTVDPASLRIQLYPAAVLRERAHEVEFGPEVVAVAERMLVLMRQAEGIGLAAPQVGLPWRLFVIDVPPPDPDDADAAAPAGLPVASDGPEVYINPVLSEPQGMPAPQDEGCLSLPGIRGEVRRPPVITIEATNLRGERFRKTGAGLLARCWQHEFDHLDGVLIIDKMSQVSRLRCRRQVQQLERAAR